MSKKDYIKLAAVIKDVGEVAKLDSEQFIVRTVAQNIATICLGDNPRFNRDRFYEACGLGCNSTRE